MSYLPVIQVEGKVNTYKVDPTYDGDSFKVPREQQYLIESTKANLEYHSELFGTATKRVFINTIPNGIGFWVHSSDI